MVGTIQAGFGTWGLAVSPDGTRLYATNREGMSVSVIDTATNTVIGSVGVTFPFGISVTPDGSKLYVGTDTGNIVSVIDTGTNTVLGTIAVGTNPYAFGTFIQPLPVFAGTPGTPNCQGTSVSALANKYGGLNSAAAAFGFAKVQGMQDAIRVFCKGR
jgi:YVTN family beta-propeller protein